MNADGSKGDYRQFFGLDADDVHEQVTEYEQDKALTKTGKSQGQSPNIFLQSLLQRSVTNI